MIDRWCDTAGLSEFDAWTVLKLARPMVPRPRSCSESLVIKVPSKLKLRGCRIMMLLSTCSDFYDRISDDCH